MPDGVVPIAADGKSIGLRLNPAAAAAFMKRVYWRVVYDRV
jgi:hypothetical protein